MVSEADAHTKQDTAKDKHDHILCYTVENGPAEEDGTAKENGHLPAVPTSDDGDEEGGDECCQVEGGGEGRQQMAVELAILVRACFPPLLPVNRREKLL